MMSQVNWIDQPKKFRECITGYPVEHYLERHHSEIDHVAGLKLNLFPYQKKALKAMVDLENKRVLPLIARFSEYRIKFNAGVLSEPVGSGKTIISIALIVQQKMPRVLPDIASWKLSSTTLEKKRDSLNTPKSIIRKEYKNILAPTLIFVSLTVLDQWINAIEKYTNLKYFAVKNVRDLRLLSKKIKSRQINDYDVVVIKNGKVNKMVSLPSDLEVEPKNKNASVVYIYNIMTNFRNYCWARVINDDMDTNGLPSNACTVNALFTWYISSTKRYTRIRNMDTSSYKTTDDSMLYSNFSNGLLYTNKILFYNLNIRSDPTFVEASNNLGLPNFYAYTFKNPNDKYISLLNVLGDEKASQISEMLNSDAVESAAEVAGVKSSNAADIFQKMLGDKYNMYTKSVKMLRFIDTIDDFTLLDMKLNPDPTEKYGKKDLLELKMPRYKYKNLTTLLRTSVEEFKEKKNISGLSIQRVKDNIKNGECPICDMEFRDASEEETDIIILKCCSLIICSDCCFNGVFKNKQASRGICSRCRSTIDIMGLIYIKGTFDLDTIVKYEFDEKKSKKAGDVEKINQTKMDTVADIINGKTPPGEKKVQVVIHNLMGGKKTLPSQEIKKVLVFSNFNETLKKMAARLKKDEIKFWYLKGSNREISNISAEFEKYKGSCALLINSVTHCAGRNFQMCTDLVFMHVIHDKNIESQVAGRGQRLGRTSTLNIRYLLYENEYNTLINSNQMRLL